MRRIRVIPVLLLHNRGLVKSVKFKDYKYIGDPINVVKIFNEKEVDEICILDISASKQKKQPDIEHIKEMVSEAFMPLSYGGGINSLDQVEMLFNNGVEKIVVNYCAVHQRDLITEVSKRYGQQSIVVSLDYKRSWLGKTFVYTLCGEENTKRNPVELAKELEDCGAGEVLLNSIERDGTYQGYDLTMIERVSQAVSVPVVAVGGASSVEDFRKAVKAGASAVSAGSMFIFQRPHNAVLVSYPNREVLKREFFS